MKLKMMELVAFKAASILMPLGKATEHKANNILRNVNAVTKANRQALKWAWDSITELRHKNKKFKNADDETVAAELPRLFEQELLAKRNKAGKPFKVPKCFKS